MLENIALKNEDALKMQSALKLAANESALKEAAEDMVKIAIADKDATKKDAEAAKKNAEAAEKKAEAAIAEKDAAKKNAEAAEKKADAAEKKADAAEKKAETTEAKMKRIIKREILSHLDSHHQELETPDAREVTLRTLQQTISVEYEEDSDFVDALITDVIKENAHIKTLISPTSTKTDRNRFFSAEEGEQIKKDKKENQEKPKMKKIEDLGQTNTRS